MAEHHDVPAMDYAEHNKTYDLFIGLMKWGTVLSLIVTLFIGASTGTVPWLFFLVLSAAITVAAAKL